MVNGTLLNLILYVYFIKTSGKCLLLPLLKHHTTELTFMRNRANLLINSVLFFFVFILFASGKLYSQSVLFDNSRVSSVYIEIHPDSLAYIMKNILSDHYFKSKFIYDYGTGRDTVKDAGFRLRGNTSRKAQKKSFKISFNEYVSGRKYQGVKKINLNGQHNDPTLVREKLFYDTWKNLGMVDRRTSFVKLYINNTYYGLYTNLEEYDKDWLQKVYGEKSGNLYKCTYPADLVYHGSNPQTYKEIGSASLTGGRAYDLQTNETEDDYTDLIDLITTLNEPADSLFALKIAQKINVDGFLKAFALDVATGNWDDYMYNKNNYFLYHRSDTHKFEFIAYDTDNTFGVDWLKLDWTTRNCLNWYMNGESRPLASKLLAVPAFKWRYQLFLDTIVRKVLNPEFIFPHIDSLQILITGAALSDTYRTLDYGYTTADFFNGFSKTVDAHTPYGIKPFIIKRSGTILEQLATTSVPEDKNSNLAVLLYPNPAGEAIRLTTFPLPEDRTGFIQDIQGRQVKSFIMPKNMNKIDIHIRDLAPGIYMLNLGNKGIVIRRKFVKK